MSRFTWEYLDEIARELSRDALNRKTLHTLVELVKELDADAQLLGSSNRRVSVAARIALQASKHRQLLAASSLGAQHFALDFKIRELFAASTGGNDSSALAGLVLDSFDDPYLWPPLETALADSGLTIAEVIVNTWTPSTDAYQMSWSFHPSDFIDAVVNSWKLQALAPQIPTAVLAKPTHISTAALLTGDISARDAAAVELVQLTGISSSTPTAVVADGGELLIPALQHVAGRALNRIETELAITLCSDMSTEELLATPLSRLCDALNFVSRP